MTVSTNYWLYGLEGELATFRSGDLTIRKMSPKERRRVVSEASNLFLAPEKIWMNMTKRFPYLGVIETASQPRLGGTSPLELIFSIADTGEVRTPIAWHPSGGSSSMALGDHQFRLVNGRFGTVRLEEVEPRLNEAWPRLGALLRADALDEEARKLFERIFVAKRLGFATEEQLLQRAAGLCMTLEYLLYEGGAGLTFRLATTVAWLLGTTVVARAEIFRVVGKVYDLRSVHVHGRRDAKPKRSDVEAMDLLLRRLIVMKLCLDSPHKEWKNFFRMARLGGPSAAERAEWLAQESVKSDDPA